MKYIISILLVMLTGCASTPSRPNNVIKVTGSGDTYEQAKQDAFKQAVEIYVGVVLVTGTEVSKDVIVKQDIVHHSAGYVDDFKVLNQYNSSGKVNLVMDVTVRNSKIAERILNKGNPADKIQGGRLAGQYSSYMASRETGDQLIDMVVKGYPEQALYITTGKTKFMLNRYRESVLVVPIEIHWNYKYLVALSEAMEVIKDKRNNGEYQDYFRISAKDPNAMILGWTNTYYFNDHERFLKIKEGLVGWVAVTVNFYSTSGEKLAAICTSAYTPVGLIATDGPEWIEGNKVLYDDIEIKTSKDGKPLKFLEQADRIEITHKKGVCYDNT